jgi:hypothetical protein
MIKWWLLVTLLPLTSASLAASVTPSFTTGTVTSHTESITTVSETIRQVDYHTGSSYTVTGTNINVPGTPGLSTPYTIHNQGQAFQFSETHFGSGISTETFIQRDTTIQSVTDSISVFSQ